MGATWEKYMGVTWKQAANVFLMIIIGSLLFGVGINGFILPHKLVSSGMSGVAIILYYLTGIQVGTWNLILNIPILYAAYRWLGRWQVVVTIFGTIIVSLAINVSSGLENLHWTQDPLVGSVMGGVLSGVGLGIVYRVGGNTGGLDPIAFIIRKYYGMQIGTILFAINALVLIAAAIVINIESAAITLIGVYATTIVTNAVVTGFNQRKAVFIVSNKTYEICNGIIHTLGRGATVIEGEGAYTQQEKHVVITVVSLAQLTRLKQIIHEADSTAFLFISDAAEVIGAGFTYGLPKGPEAMAQRALHQAAYHALEAEKASRVEMAGK
ncbi:MAG: YitT family protein [Veillonellaceae bacterium]|nr:YitT family protein [Veillonellaceae bacterium]